MPLVNDFLLLETGWFLRLETNFRLIIGTSTVDFYPGGVAPSDTLINTVSLGDALVSDMSMSDESISGVSPSDESISGASPADDSVHDASVGDSDNA